MILFEQVDDDFYYYKPVMPKLEFNEKYIEDEGKDIGNRETFSLEDFLEKMKVN